MQLVIGTASGVFVTEERGAYVTVPELEGRSVRYLGRPNGSLLAGADTGVFRSADGRSWRPSGIAGRMVWDIAPAPHDSMTLYAVVQPAGFFRSRDGGTSWEEVGTFMQTPGADQWCLPGNPPTAARARTLVVDRADPARLWVGVEVGGVVATDDQGKTWQVTLPGGNPDLHVMVSHPARPGVLYCSTGLGRPPSDLEPMERRTAGVYESTDGGRTWQWLWHGMSPRYTRPLCIDPRPPYALTVASAPTAFSSFRDEGGAQAVLYQRDDDHPTWRNLGDPEHTCSQANFHAIVPDPETPGGIIAGTDTGEVWRISPACRWTLLVSGLPMVQAIYPLIV